MAKVKWSLWRRFKSLKFWSRFSAAGSMASIIGIPLGIIALYLTIYYGNNPLPEISVSEAERSELENVGAPTSKVQNLLETIQNERNEAINDSIQIEFIKVISNIYKTISPSAKIILNDVFIDSVTGQKFRSDVIIEEYVSGHKIKLLVRLNPYIRPLGKSEMISFQNHIEKINASKGILITKGKFEKDAIKYAKNISIDIATFKDSSNNFWKEKFMVPVLIKLISVNLRVGVDFIYEKGAIPHTDGKKIEFSMDGGKSVKFLIDLFNNSWNSEGGIDFFDKNGELKEGTILFNEKEMLIRFSKAQKWLKSENITIKYFPKAQYRFNYVQPEVYKELCINYDKKPIYGSYTFKNEDMTEGINFWEEIKDLDKFIENVKWYLPITGIDLQTNESINTSNGNVEKVIK